MPFRCDVSETGFVTTIVVGPVGLDEIRVHLREARRRQAHLLPGVVDLRNAHCEPVTLRDLLSMARLAWDTIGEASAPRAVVVGSRRHFEWARMFAGLVAGWVSIGVFTDAQEAWRWLEHRADRRVAQPERRAVARRA